VAQRMKQIENKEEQAATARKRERLGSKE